MATRDYRAVMVGSIWEDPGIRVGAEEWGSASGTSAGVVDHSEAIKKAKQARARRRHEEDTHHAIVARAPTTLRSYGAPRGAEPPKPTPSRALPPRELRNLYISQVGRFQFKLIHRMEGRWNGEATVYDGSSESETRVVSVELLFDERAKQWKERQTLTSSSGLATTQVFHFDPAADGVLTVTTDDPALVDVVDMRMEEQSENILILTAISHTTRRPLIVETVTLIDDLRRVRTVQRFQPDGSFACLYHIRESRVIDSVSGAVEEVHGR